MQSDFSAQERRKFLRISYATPVKFKIHPPKFLGGSQSGISKNISQSGLLFKSEKKVDIGSVLWLNLDFKTLEICRDMEEKIYSEKGGFLARVVRIEENPDNTYNLGCCFLLKNEKAQ